MKVTTGRKIPKNYRNITGKISSQKAHGTVAYESKLERDYYILFELNPAVIFIKEQPVTLKSKTSGLSYTPDFELHILEDGKRKIIIGEVKYRKDLRKDWETLRPKFEMAIEYSQTLENTSFKIFTDRCPRIASKNYLFNAHFLLNFKIFDHKAYQLLKDNFKKNVTIDELLSRCSNDDTIKLNLLSTVWYLIRRGAIEVDLYKKLSTSNNLKNFHKYTEAEPLQLVREVYST